VPKSVLEAIREGQWNYEPEEVRTESYHQTEALPGSPEKIGVLADRLQQGLPLWHPADRRNCVGLFGDDDEDD
jgi:hypothetical protein